MGYSTEEFFFRMYGSEEAKFSEFILVAIPNLNGSSYTHHVFRENNKSEFIFVAIPNLNGASYTHHVFRENNKK
jgi:hypothetical protein